MNRPSKYLNIVPKSLIVGLFGLLVNTPAYAVSLNLGIDYGENKEISVEKPKLMQLAPQNNHLTALIKLTTSNLDTNQLCEHGSFKQVNGIPLLPQINLTQLFKEGYGVTMSYYKKDCDKSGKKHKGDAQKNAKYLDQQSKDAEDNQQKSYNSTNTAPKQNLVNDQAKEDYLNSLKANYNYSANYYNYATVSQNKPSFLVSTIQNEIVKWQQILKEQQQAIQEAKEQAKQKTEQALRQQSQEFQKQR